MARVLTQWECAVSVSMMEGGVDVKSHEGCRCPCSLRTSGYLRMDDNSIHLIRVALEGVEHFWGRRG
eukprot:m.491641 g.491641  ORF g.491641 m.491641 type:complete len:67 (-) comp30425_c0_seq1:569-769(-)